MAIVNHRTNVREGVLTYASRLRFPTLFTITAILLVINLVVPDPIPFVDEILMGLVTLVLGSLRERYRVVEQPK